MFWTARHGVTVCAGSLAKKIARRRSLRDKENRKRNLEQYVDGVVENLMSIMKKEADIKFERVTADDEQEDGNARSAGIFNTLIHKFCLFSLCV